MAKGNGFVKNQPKSSIGVAEYISIFSSEMYFIFLKNGLNSMLKKNSKNVPANKYKKIVEVDLPME